MQLLTWSHMLNNFPLSIKWNLTSNIHNRRNFIIDITHTVNSMQFLSSSISIHC